VNSGLVASVICFGRSIRLILIGSNGNLAAVASAAAKPLTATATVAPTSRARRRRLAPTGRSIADIGEEKGQGQRDGLEPLKHHGRSVP
jgi:hypothetical protein